MTIILPQVVGWGQTEDGTKSEDLMMVTLRVDSYLECYLKDRRIFGKRLRPGKNFCAGVNGQDTLFIILTIVTFFPVF